MAQFTMRRGPEPGRVYNLTQDTVQIGRGAKNDIVIIDNEVSREHCRLERTEFGYEICDLESSNGTFVNGQRVNEPVILPLECIVELGDSITLEYHTDDDDMDMNTQQVTLEREIVGDGQGTAFLVVIAHSQPIPAVYPLEGEVIEVGRGTTNNVIIVEPEISRNHLRLTASRHGYMIQDLESTNGTSVNGVLLKEPTLLHDGDVIRIGTTIVIRYTTNPQMFMSKKTTSSLRHPDEVKEPTRVRRTQSSVPPSLADTPLSPSLVGTGIEPGSLVDHILLVYARHEWETLVAPIVDRLYNLEIPVWVDQYLAPGGDDWKLALAQARSECWLLIVIVTHASMGLEYIQKIWRHFHNREKSVIMVMVDDVDRLPIGANVAYKISYNPAQIEATLRQIVSAIKQLE